MTPTTPLTHTLRVPLPEVYRPADGEMGSTISPSLSVTGGAPVSAAVTGALARGGDAAWRLAITKLHPAGSGFAGFHQCREVASLDCGCPCVSEAPDSPHPTGSSPMKPTASIPASSTPLSSRNRRSPACGFVVLCSGLGVVSRLARIGSYRLARWSSTQLRELRHCPSGPRVACNRAHAAATPPGRQSRIGVARRGVTTGAHTGHDRPERRFTDRCAPAACRARRREAGRTSCWTTAATRTSATSASPPRPKPTPTPVLRSRLDHPPTPLPSGFHAKRSQRDDLGPSGEAAAIRRPTSRAGSRSWRTGLPSRASGSARARPRGPGSRRS